MQNGAVVSEPPTTRRVIRRARTRLHICNPPPTTPSTQARHQFGVLIDPSRSAPARRDIDPQQTYRRCGSRRSHGRCLCEDERDLEATRLRRCGGFKRARTHRRAQRSPRPGLLTVNVGSVPPRTRCLPRIPKRRIRGFLLWTKL